MPPQNCPTADPSRSGAISLIFIELPRATAPRSGAQSAPARLRPIAYDLAVTAPVVVILAAGQGTRMRSAVQKLLHPLCGRPIIEWPIAAARAAGAAKIVVVDSPERRLEGVA